MTAIAGVDVGSTYTKAVVLAADGRILGSAQRRTGFRLEEAAAETLAEACARAGEGAGALDYVVATGSGRFQVPCRDAQVTDLTAHARGARALFASTRTVLDIGGQTVKASRLDERGRVVSFRLNDKCAAGTGAFLEKTARYLGFATEEIGPLATTSHTPVSISGVCAVFAESEVINHVSNGAAPADILCGAIASLVDRSVQLLRRLRVEPDCTVVGGVLRFEAMARLLRGRLGGTVHVPQGELAQLTGALGAAVLGLQRWQRARGEG